VYSLQILRYCCGAVTSLRSSLRTKESSGSTCTLASMIIRNTLDTNQPETVQILVSIALNLVLNFSADAVTVMRYPGAKLRQDKRLWLACFNDPVCLAAILCTWQSGPVQSSIRCRAQAHNQSHKWLRLRVVDSETREHTGPPVSDLYSLGWSTRRSRVLRLNDDGL
jgi:hypothetical protein